MLPAAPGWVWHACRVPPSVTAFRDLTRTTARRVGPIGLGLVLLLSGCSSPANTTTLGAAQPPTPVIAGQDATPPSATPAASTPGPTIKANPKPAVPKKTPTAPPPWAYAADGPAFGTSGPVWRYRVAVENGLAVTPASFAAEVNSVLQDPRSWIARNDVRLQQIGPTGSPHFTVWLATPATAATLCASGGVDITENGAPFTSCRAGSNVVINSDRYFSGVHDYGASLEVYRAYMINHEVGHWLGHNHELCPGTGQPAPVMQQQTLGLQGCVANSWPYLNGARYAGPSA
jgi:hypothetical protein